MQIPLSLSALKSNTKMGRILAPESDSAFFNAYPKATLYPECQLLHGK